MLEAARRLRISHQAVSTAWHRLFGDRQPPGASMRSARAARSVERIVELCAAGQSAAEIAATVGVSRGLVQHVLHRRGLLARNPNRVDRAAMDAALTAITDGASLGEAAAEHGISYSYLSVAAKQRGVQLPMGPRGRMDGRVLRASRA
jgi:hypothetical protein